MNENEIAERLGAALIGRRCFGAVSEDVIRGAERSLGVVFPRSYRVFLRELGASYGINPYDLPGLPPTRRTDPEPPEFSNVIDDTELARRACGVHLPFQYVAVSSDGCDCQFYLDTGRLDAEQECPVVALGPCRDDEIVAQSFLEFVEKIASGTQP